MSTANGNELDYCMKKALEDRLSLDGSQGHYLRLAIAVKARSIGMSPEDTARLFQHQSDYSYEFSLKKAQEAWTYDYSPWSCETLRDKCGTIVKGYCKFCRDKNKMN